MRGRPLVAAVLLGILLFPLAPLAGDSEMPEASPEARIIYLVRHAETEPPPYADTPPNPPLSEAGQGRAALLTGVLGDAGIEQIFSTDYRRTQSTARPLAASLGLTVEPYNPRDLEGFAAQLRTGTGRVLVVGHSNTTPALVRHLGGNPLGPIDEKKEFDRLYVVVIEAGRTITSTQLRYGKDRR